MVTTPSATPCWTSLGSHGPAFQASPGLSGWHPFLLHQLHRSAWCHQANLLRMHSVLLYKLLIKNTRPKTGPLRDWIYVRWWSNFLTRWAFSPFQVTLLLCLWFLYPCVSIVVKSNLQNASRSMPWKICCLYFTQEFPNIIPQGDNTGQLNKLSQEKKKNKPVVICLGQNLFLVFCLSAKERIWLSHYFWRKRQLIPLTCLRKGALEETSFS